MKITAKTVASKANVSPATVSLVVNGKSGVSAAVRQHVLDVAQELGYSIKSEPGKMKSRNIQLVIYKRHGRVISDTPFFENLIQGASNEAGKLGYQLSIVYFYGNENTSEQLRVLNSSNSIGIILLATEMHNNDLAIFDSLKIPIVLLDNWLTCATYNSVVIDNFAGAFNAVEYLIRSGHTRIGYLHSKVNIHNFAERWSGYNNAVRTLLPQDNDSIKRVISVGPSVDSAYLDMTEYLATDPVLPTAFFADNDVIAAGCLRALNNAGYRSPEQVSIIGFDDVPLCQLLTPTLTTMSVPKEFFGATAMQCLDATIRNSNKKEITRTCVLPQLRVRESVFLLNR